MIKKTIKLLAFSIILIVTACSKDKNIDADPLTVDFNISVSSDFAPAEVTITNNTTAATSYNWSFTGGTPESSTDQNPSTVSYSSAGEYTISLEASNGTETKTSSKIFSIGEPLTVDFDISVSSDFAPAEVTITNNSSGATSYNWSFTGGTPESSTDQNPSTVSYTVAGEYTINLEVSNGTETKTTSKTFVLNTNEAPSSNNNQIKLLTGKTPQEIGESFVTINGEQIAVISIDMDEDDGINYIVFYIGEDEFVAISYEDEEINGEYVIAELSDGSFSANNLPITSSSEDIFEITGSLEAENSNSKSLTVLFDVTSLGGGSSTISINGDIATINGDLGSVTYNQILDLNANNRNVHTIVLEDVPGSVNDEVNVETGRLIREAGYTTELKSDSEVFSGGVDLFCSGVKRIIADGATIGVHSWCCGSNGEQASDIPENDSQHNILINYFNEMLGEPNGRNFYFFTINAASFNDIYYMTNSEIEQYQLATE